MINHWILLVCQILKQPSVGWWFQDVQTCWRLLMLDEYPWMLDWVQMSATWSIFLVAGPPAMNYQSNIPRTYAGYQHLTRFFLGPMCQRALSVVPDLWGERSPGEEWDVTNWLIVGYGYGSIPINTIFSGMNIHLPAILMFTRGTRFWHTAI